MERFGWEALPLWEMPFWPASLVGASLVGASLVGVSLVGASLAGASSVGDSSVGAYLVGASLVDALWQMPLWLASLVDASLEDTSLSCLAPVSRGLLYLLALEYMLLLLAPSNCFLKVLHNCRYLNIFLKVHKKISQSPHVTMPMHYGEVGTFACRSNHKVVNFGKLFLCQYSSNT